MYLCYFPTEPHRTYGKMFARAYPANNFSNLNICDFFCNFVIFNAIMINVNNIAGIRKMTDAQQCVLCQYKIQVDKLVDFDRQISEGQLFSK